MTKSQFRNLLLLSFVVGLVGGLSDLMVPSLIADAFRQAQEAHDAELSLARLLVGLAIALAGLSLVLAATYGLYQFRHWAPRIGLVGTVLTLFAWPAFGASAQSGVSVSISYAASYLWGAVLVLSHVPPYSAWFVKPATP